MKKLKGFRGQMNDVEDKQRSYKDRLICRARTK